MQDRTLTITLEDLCLAFNTLLTMNDLDGDNAFYYNRGLFDFFKHIVSYSGKITDLIFEEDLETERATSSGSSAGAKEDATTPATIPFKGKEGAKTKSRPAR